MDLDFSVFAKYFPVILQSLGATLALFAGSVVLGTFGGAIVAFLRLAPVKILNYIAHAFTWLFRGLPPLIILFFTYYALPDFGLDLSPMAAGIIGLALTGSAYNAEIFRSGVISVDRGQWEASEALAISKGRYLWRILAPQAFRISIPPYFSNMITMMKATSLASVIAVTEITGAANRLISTTYRPMEILLIAAVLYLLLNTVIVFLQSACERKFAVHN